MNEFQDLKLEDIKVGGKALEAAPVVATPAAVEPTKVETAPVTAPAVDELTKATPTPAATEPTKVEPTKVEATKVEPVIEPVKTEPPAPAEYKFKDDYIKAVVDYYEKTGDFTPYIEAKSIDYTKLTDEEIMKRDLKTQYPTLSDKAFDVLYKEQVADKYKLDSELHGADATEVGREFLKVEAEAKRKKLIEAQEAFKAPEREVSAEESEYNARQAEVQKVLSDFREATNNHAETKAILDSKKLTIKIGDAEVNYEVADPNSILEATLDNNKFFAQFQNPDKSIDYKRWYKAVAYSQNPELFEKTLFDKGKAEGREEIQKEIKNTTDPKGGDVPTDGEGDFNTGLLTAFKQRGVHK